MRYMLVAFATLLVAIGDANVPPTGENEALPLQNCSSMARPEVMAAELQVSFEPSAIVVDSVQGVAYVANDKSPAAAMKLHYISDLTKPSDAKATVPFELNKKFTKVEALAIARRRRAAGSTTLWLLGAAREDIEAGLALIRIPHGPAKPQVLTEPFRSAAFLGKSRTN